jgi:hypothetical protein
VTLMMLYTVQALVQRSNQFTDTFRIRYKSRGDGDGSWFAFITSSITSSTWNEPKGIDRSMGCSEAKVRQLEARPPIRKPVGHFVTDATTLQTITMCTTFTFRNGPSLSFLAYQTSCLVFCYTLLYILVSPCAKPPVPITKKSRWTNSPTMTP